MKLTSRQTYKVIFFVLQNPVFTQTQVFNSVKVSWGRMNEIIQWLVKKNFAEKKKANYELTDPAGLVLLFSLNRDMNSLLLKKMSLRLSKKEILEMIPKKTILCLDSALEFYSGYFHSNRICIYVEENSMEFKKIEKDFLPFSSGNSELLLFKPDIMPETVKAKGFLITGKLRTLIDLICDNKSHFAKDLYKQLWGLKFEE